MSRNAKIVLVIAGTLFAMCCMLSATAILLLPKVAENTVTQNPQKAREIAAQIADYTLPPGYTEEFSMDLFTTKMVVISRPDHRGLMLMWMQISQLGMSREQMEAQMRQSLQQQFQSGVGALTKVGTEQVTIKGEPVTFTIYEGANTTTRASVRQEIGVFPGKGGTAMLMITGAISAWDAVLIDDYLKSIR
jgi:hypothetical protein